MVVVVGTAALVVELELVIGEVVNVLRTVEVDVVISLVIAVGVVAVFIREVVLVG